MASITNLGSTTGLPLEDILTKLQAAEDKKLSLYTNRQASYEARVSAFGQIQSAVEAVQKAAEALGKNSVLDAVKANVSGNGLTATVGTDGATMGEYSIKVNKLATAHTLQSGLVADRKASNGATGSFTIELANGETRTIDLKNDTSLNGIANAINSDDKVGVRASIINDGSGNSYLMLSAKDTGEQASVKSITVTGDQKLKDILNYNTDPADLNPKMVQQTVPVDAEIEVNGIPIKSGSNNISTAIDGVTLNLTATTEAGKTVTLKLESDTSVASKAIQEFVTAYNSLQNTIAKHTAFDVAAETNQALTGDATTRSIQSTMSNALRIVTSEGSLRTLADLGVALDPKTGTLKIDQKQLDKALIENPADVKRIMTSTDGLTAQFTAAAKSMLGDNGSIKIRQEGLTESIKDVKDQLTRAKASSDASMATMRAQFVALEKFVSQQTATANYLTQQFAALSKSK
ncbi:flagellar filament capping protein FliD [Achromobacter insolitus]|uniref:flagellar filament capping protein FliD n=1 Tax=Achromobacter insolitus TaxID=217204 RepID=UPI000B51C4F6|nr:flagellar filament capping protein FliD [Achromobacter insolitus]AXA69671.1 flagellar hook protein FliD [Achromobacter insolitus]MDH3065042.1 flagellar filament capping protein FliD [Achromobacter insolitus]NGT17500.1 flagellar filament capping protein FliD [Achromobacter insolitus]OWT61269.1 flagellar hook protein FliD [Achromobacter insolitus]CAB3694590.1 Flagellar hook-associated protein 2 [Achromobacter insolitus]